MKNIIFDFDGTLADTSEGIYAAFTLACELNDLEKPNKKVFKKYIGPPMNKMFPIIFPGLSAETKLKFIRNFRILYDEYLYEKVSWYIGVKKTLRTVYSNKSYKLSIITNKPTQCTNKLLKISNLDKLFEMIIGIDYLKEYNMGDNNLFKSKSEAIRFFIDEKGINSKDCIYIGDTIKDKLASEANNVSFIAATYGFYNWKDKEIPKLNISSFEDLLIKNYLNKSVIV
tara:strand:+ start:30 stop:713 length:684 start_codon:yes stop_codon:yes gene_type:complete